MRPATTLLIPFLLLVLSAATTVEAEDFPVVLGYDVSTRSAALGGASNAMFWGEELDSWGNPALLGEAHGVHVTTSHTRVAPFLTDRASFESADLVFGAEGLGFVVSGSPHGLGHVLLDYGPNPVRNAGGYPTGSADSFESVDSWGFGVSFLKALRAVSHLWGSDLSTSDRFDVLNRAGIPGGSIP